MPEGPAASVVIPTRHRPHYLEVTLSSVMPQAKAAGVEVIIVSDGPDQEAAGVTHRHGATFISLREERGLNAARNEGIRAAQAELIVFIDDDVEAPKGWIDAVLAGARSTPDREVFGGPIRPRLERGPRSCGREPGPITALDAGPIDRDIERVWGANMAIRRGAFERVGLFDERLQGPFAFAQRGDEEDWEIRYTAAGGRIRYLAGAGLDHRRAPADARLRVLTRHAYEQGRQSRRHDMLAGKERTIRAEVRILAGCAWHTVRRRCAYGIVMGARAAGSLREVLARRSA